MLAVNIPKDWVNTYTNNNIWSDRHTYSSPIPLHFTPFPQTWHDPDQGVSPQNRIYIIFKVDRMEAGIMPNHRQWRNYLYFSLWRKFIYAICLLPWKYDLFFLSCFISMIHRVNILGVLSKLGKVINRILTPSDFNLNLSCNCKCVHGSVCMYAYVYNLTLLSR